jgi:hypothetical protein
MTAQDFTADIAAACPSERQNFRVTLMDYPARRFCESRGFALVRETDGSGHEEKEPDVLYLWTR